MFRMRRNRVRPQGELHLLRSRQELGAAEKDWFTRSAVMRHLAGKRSTNE